MPWGKANVVYSAKDAKYLTNWLMIRRQQNLPNLSCAAVQKGHMIEQVINKRNHCAVEKFTKQLTQRKKVVDSLIYSKD